MQKEKDVKLSDLPHVLARGKRDVPKLPKRLAPLARISVYIRPVHLATESGHLYSAHYATVSFPELGVIDDE